LLVKALDLIDRRQSIIYIYSTKDSVICAKGIEYFGQVNGCLTLPDIPFCECDDYWDQRKCGKTIVICQHILSLMMAQSSEVVSDTEFKQGLADHVLRLGLLKA
jgi:predicted nucleic acid-binding Zn finger protein